VGGEGVGCAVGNILFPQFLRVPCSISSFCLTFEDFWKNRCVLKGIYDLRSIIAMQQYIPWVM
jgi:hypothetical protein